MKPKSFSRRDLFKLGSAGAAVLTGGETLAAGKKGPVCEEGGCCITPSGDFYNVERGNPLPYKLPLEKQREIGMVQQGVDILPVARSKGHTHACRQVFGIDCLRVAAVQRLQQAVQHGPHLLLLDGTPQHHGKFLAAQACHRVAASAHGEQALPEQAQRVVARGVAPGLKEDAKRRMLDGPLEPGAAMKHLQELVRAGGPTYIKLGQIMSLRRDLLPDSITDELKNLLDRLPDDALDLIDPLHLIADDIYIDIQMLSWGQGDGGGGAFSYRRSTAPARCARRPAASR